MRQLLVAFNLVAEARRTIILAQDVAILGEASV